MTVFTSTRPPPEWCELRAFDVIDLSMGERLDQRRRAPKERLLGTVGTTQLLLTDGSVVLKEGQFFDVAADEWAIRGCSPRAQIVRLSGRWGKDLGGCGLFRVANQENPSDAGDPVAYPKKTSVDSHYHDCDEYWIVLEGAGTVVVGGRTASVSPGDCLAIGMGHHHDFPAVDAPVKAVFFETTLEGAKRVGHLWAHTHGPAQPKPERI